MVRSRVVGAVLLGGLCLSTALWAQSPKELRQLSAEEIARITQAMPAKAAVAPAQPRKMLVFWKCETFYHDVIPVANEALRIMGEKTGAFQVTVVTDDYSVFTAETLKQFDAVCLNNTTSLKFDPAATPERCKALMDFVKSGKGLIGIHAAADNFYQWPEGQEMMGNKFTGHPWGAGGTWAYKIDVPDHPLMAPFKGQGFKLSDEIYRTDPPLYSRDKQFVLMSLDTSDPTTRNVRDFKATDVDTGITWIKEVGKGRLFYCSFGHNHAIFMNPTLLEHYLLGIQFAMGDLKVPTQPIADTTQGQTANALVETVKAYDFGQSREALTQISEEIRKAYGQPDALKKFEASLIEVLKSDAKYAGKQYACRELSIIGTSQSAPVLAGMLTSEEYSDMARYALERIPGEAADKAFLEALPKAQGKAKTGIVNSLGERECVAAAPAIAQLVDNSDKVLAGAAISALGKIGGPEALKGLDKALQTAADAQKMSVYDAYLKVAEKMVAAGDKLGAQKIYISLNKDGVPQLVRSAAMKGMVKSTQSSR
ncbi:MAG TPA: ThuA domain-containing protein [Sedimentisphaerales bacterium]|jgi:type 1 glutamine amidotransferase|nr:ThuA domain-containing protein [Sedimentisphaerales bacterium]HNU27615.1 ThuA domain-containing protein [Sedimentisphaerales bacterium]